MATAVGPVRPSQALRQRRESQRPNLNRNMSKPTLADASAALNRIMEDMPFGTCNTVLCHAVICAAAVTRETYTDATYSTDNAVHFEQVQRITSIPHHPPTPESFPPRSASGDLPLRFAHERAPQTYSAKDGAP